MSTDIVSNMISIIKNASLVGKPYVEIRHTNECEAISKVLKAEGYLKDFNIFKETKKPFKMLHLDIAYDNELPLINDIKRVSRPGRRVYKGVKDLNSYMGGYGVYIVSTSRGVMSDADARNKRLGGEILCKVF